MPNAKQAPETAVAKLYAAAAAWAWHAVS